ncbi:creatininase family protein [Azospirillum sp. RWY-5-1]|uniref:Creatininase family protein n=1 Tax=Azospirillum oleiclasticum TaxID=2735135 RepID=A0ABX2T8D3_9PROT|nr:creatininase family protein [Azospirillum oleiclasticum]NYZ12347.1 creatininase family protein [Azospirillum oleiclasticum]NYZ19507.1 creatininase family protein [Azospirillum oleiclasticum]
MLRFWQEMTAADFRTLPADAVAILPVAATEQHGPHLPTGTDHLILDGILKAAARTAPNAEAVALPVQPVGWSPEHGRFPGTLSLDAELLVRAWTELGVWVKRSGFTRLLILNSHGGNPPAIDITAMRLRADHGLLVVKSHWETLAEPGRTAPPGAPALDWHGGWIETSVMLHLHPALVRMEHAADSPVTHPHDLPPDGPAHWAWMTGDLNPAGVLGNPSLASAERGETLVGHAVSGLADLLLRMQKTAWPPAPA